MGRYYYMLPSEDNGTHWGQSDIYRVQVNAELFWNATNTNYSSHGTGDTGEFTPFGSINNNIVWNDPDNWQRWDVQVPGVDLKPTNVKINELEYTTTPAYITIEGGQDITISGNVTNIGISEPPTSFNFTFYESNSDGAMISSEFLVDIEITEKLSPGSVTEEYTIEWQVPSLPGIYFIALFADHNNDIPESNKANNLFLIGFIIGGVPDLDLNNVHVNEIKYETSHSPIIFVGKAQKVTISANITNIGTENTGQNFLFNITLTYLPSITSSVTLLSKTILSLDPDEDTGQHKIEWNTPDFNTQCKIRLNVDPGDQIQEIREDNNNFVLIFEVSDLADLNVKNISKLTRTVPIGSLNKIEVKISNIGHIQSNTSKLGFYNGTEFDEFQPSYDIATAIKLIDIASLQPGQSTISELKAIWMAPMIVGTYDVTVKIDMKDEIDELSEINNIIKFKFIVEDYPEPPLPTLNFTDNGIKLNWLESPTPNRDHYLIYRSETPTGFDFSKPYFNTSNQLIPLLNEWIDINSIHESNELYYCLRTVNIYGWAGYSSLTVGKYTKIFSRGYDTFSLPLEPFDRINAKKFLEGLSKPYGSPMSGIDDMTTVYNYEVITQQWMGHPKFLPEDIDNFQIEFGKGYMIYTPNEVEYTFTGYPGSMIRYIDIFYTSQQFRENIGIEITGNLINITWNTIDNAVEYKIYRSRTRTEINYSDPFSISNNNIEVFGLTTDLEYYFTIIPVDSYGRFGSSTYSIGLSLIDLAKAYNTFASKLDPENKIEVDSVLEMYFNNDVDTIYYYNTSHQSWQGHPRFLPGSVDNFQFEVADAFMTYVYLDEVRIIIIGR
jgi:hypothetical protein